MNESKVLRVTIPAKWQKIVPHAPETFFQRSPEERSVFDIELQGTCRLQGFFRTHEADALYVAVDGRFLKMHYDLFIDGKDLFQWNWRCKTVAVDRGSHSYTLRCRFQDGGSQVGIALGYPSVEYAAESLGALQARVIPRPDLRKIEKETWVRVTPPTKTSSPRSTPEQRREKKLRGQEIDLRDKVELAFHRVAIEQRIRARVDSDYGHLDDDERQQIVYRLLDEVTGETQRRGKIL